LNFFFFNQLNPAIILTLRQKNTQPKM